MNVVGNCLQEIGVCDLLFVGTNVNVRRFGKDLAHLVQNVFQFCHALIRLHRMTHSTLKSLTVSGHVYLGNHLYAVVCGKTDNLATLFLCVILADKARHAGGRCQLWVLLHFEAPCLVFGQMPVEGINLETTHQAYLLLQLIDTNVTASHIVHPTTKFEGWPIGYRAERQTTIFAFCHLCQGLNSTNDARFRCSLYADTLTGNNQSISFIRKTCQRIVARALNRRNHLDLQRKHISFRCQFLSKQVL